jgi:hypothetical protein
MDSIIMVHSDNQLVHAFTGDTLADVAAEIRRQTNLCRPGVGMEFFDCAGHRLVPEFGMDWTLKTLHRTVDGPDPALVRRRLEYWIEYVVARLAADPVHLHEYLVAFPDPQAANESPIQSLTRVMSSLPRPSEESLADCFKKLDVHSGLSTQHWGDPIHALSHLFGGT